MTSACVNVARVRRVISDSDLWPGRDPTGRTRSLKCCESVLAEPLYLAEWNGRAIYGAIYGNPMSRCHSVYQGGVTLVAGVLHVVILVQRDEEQMSRHVIYNESKKAKAQRWFAGRICKKTTSLFHCLFCVGVSRDGLHLTSLFPLALLLISLVFKKKKVLLFGNATSDAQSFIDRFCVTIENAGGDGGLRTNRAQISLRRDICSETISQVVICGIIASPTHKCMGVCTRYASLCVCVCGIRRSQECPPNCLTGL